MVITLCGMTDEGKNFFVHIKKLQIDFFRFNLQINIKQS